MVDRQELTKIARLAKLSLSEEQMDALTADMEKIIAFADTVNALAADTGVVFEREATAQLREDAVEASCPRADILRNVDGGEDGCFPVRERM